MKLYTYCIPVDDGAAPNPYYEICTLAICKPAIRRTAEIGDWIVGTGSKNVNGTDYSNKVVYAMKVTQKMTYADYNSYCEDEFKTKIPDLNHTDYSRKVGDCIYDDDDLGNTFQRNGVHGTGNIQTDKNGHYVLLSDHFYYFGNQPIEIPESLLAIVHQTQGHKVRMNESYKYQFEDWIESLGFEKNHVLNAPQIQLEFEATRCLGNCADVRKLDGEVGELGIC